MLINIKKSDVTLETKGPVSGSVPFLSCNAKGDCSPLSHLSFEGFSGFNEKYAVQLFLLMRTILTKKDMNFYKSIIVNGNLHNDDKMYSAEFFILKNVRDTAFLFRTLKSFSISLPDLRIGYSEESAGNATLYLDRKIIKIINDLGYDSCKELVLYFYCLARFLFAFNTVCPPIGTSTSGDLTLFEEDIKALYAAYGEIPNDLNVECLQLKEDVHFKSVSYTHSQYIPFIKDLNVVKYGSTFVYNVIKTTLNQFLCIINTTLKEYYLINKKTGVIYTNNVLQEFNTFDSIEWIPNLVNNMASLLPNEKQYTVRYIPADKLLCSKTPEVIISNDASEYEALLDCYPSITENNNLKLYDGYFVGSTLKSEGGLASLEEYYAKDAYAQELYKQVQPYYETFDLKDLTGIVKGVAKGDVYSMLFEGESGTGKSTAARVIASRCGLPFVAINCSTNIEESDIFGAMIPNPKKASADDPEFIWEDGQLTKAIRNGYVGIIEELNFGRPGVLGKINSLLDESRQIDLPNGEVLKAHPNFRLIATVNIGYEGTNRLNKALVNRFEICKKFEDLDEKEAKKVIVARTGYTNIDKLNKVLDVYRAIKKYSKEQNLQLVVSIRQLLVIFTQGKYYKDAKDAINNLMLNQAFLEEPEHLKHFKDTVISVFDLSFKI